jgi:S1-C subfamily serine protease
MSAVLQQFSSELESCIAAAERRVVAIRNAARQHVTGLVWDGDTIVASEQAIGSREEYEIVTHAGATARARIVGRDPGTNLLALRADRSLDASPAPRATARRGALAIALGADIDGAITTRIGAINAVGPQWVSRAGGRLDSRITLDIRLDRTEEGGPVLIADGALLGMSTLGVRHEVLVIPYATLERVVPQLLRDGCVPRGWLGIALQPVAVPDALVGAAGQRGGMMVMSTVDDGPAARAGVTAGDILLTIGGIEVQGTRQLASQLNEDSIGTSLTLRVIRGGQIVALQTLIESKKFESKK